VSTIRHPRALLGAVTLAAATIVGVATTPPAPAGAGPLPGPIFCPAQPKVITSDAVTIIGSACAEIINVGPHTESVKALGGDDVVRLPLSVSLPSAMSKPIIELGPGNDRYEGGKDNHALVRGGLGKDHMITTPESTSGLFGGEGDDMFVIRGWNFGVARGEAGNDRIFDQRHNAVLCICEIDGGEGNDLVDTTGATADGSFEDVERDIVESAGDDVYVLRQAPGNAFDRIISAGGTTTGFDTAYVDAEDEVWDAAQIEVINVEP
jgi:hypothetical protein